jgi:hypothetical protein
MFNETNVNKKDSEAVFHSGMTITYFFMIIIIESIFSSKINSTIMK